MKTWIGMLDVDEDGEPEDGPVLIRPGVWASKLVEGGTLFGLWSPAEAPLYSALPATGPAKTKIRAGSLRQADRQLEASELGK